MMTPQPPDTLSRDDEIRLIWTHNQWLYIVVGFMAGLLAFPLLQLMIADLSGLLGSLVPEAVGIGFTVLLIDRLNRHRDERNAKRALKEQLLRDVRSGVNDVAVNAIHQMQERKLLEGGCGLLKGIKLQKARLQEAILRKANLQHSRLAWADLAKADLQEANLQGANLWRTNLQSAHLSSADLQNANLQNANLKGADLGDSKLREAILGGANLQAANLMGADLSISFLERADLRKALLTYANLQGASLRDANLEGAILENLWGAAQFDETTILPDGTHWTPETDMRRFTHPEEYASDSAGNVGK